MHRFRSWTLDPPEYRTQRNRLLPIEGGDGSTLNLDFTTGVLDPRLKFDRLGNATFINSSGYVELAAANMIKRSGDLSQNSAGEWTIRSNLTTTEWTGFEGPLGSTKAIKLIPNTTNSTHYVGSSDVSLAIGLPHTVSLYVKASGYNFVGLVTTNSNARAHFNLSNQTSAGYGVSSSRTITDVGNGWYRITMSFVVANGPLVSLWIYAMNAATDPVVNSFAGASGSSDGVLVWGAQINLGNTIQPYYETETNPYYAPRFDHDPNTGSPRGLLIEGSANNLVTRSQTLNTTAWLKSATNISETGTGSPANDATSNVLTWTNGTAVGSAYTEQSSIAVSPSQPYTWSVWLKNRGNQRVSVFGYTKTSTNTFSGNLEMTVDFSVATPTASITTSTNFTSTSVTTPVAFGNGWYRCTMTGTTPSTAATTGFGISNKDAVPASGTNGCEVWGAQLETGSGASSYIPTGANQGNRAKDECSITGNSFSSWFTNPNEGSFFVQYSMNYPSASMGAGIDRYAFEISDSAGTSRALCIAAYRNTPVGRNVRVFNPSGTSFDSGDTLTTSSALNTKFAFGYATANNYIAAVGVAQAFQTYNIGSLPTSPAINQMWIGSNRSLSSTTYLFGCIRTIKYWPTRLPNATLQGLVS